ncbi:MAG: trehalose-phosphatase [Bryobacteraceae bacterium]|jgi:trehalose 6-phosphate phosphatase
MRTPSAELVSAVGDRIRSAPRISLFLDFDGTLVPIEPSPDVPQVDPATIDILRLLASREGLVTTIISGRAIADLHARIPLPPLIYAGNHGLEILGRQLRFVEPAACERRTELERLCAELELELRGIAGAAVERKGLTASVHHRLAAAEDRAAIERIVYAAVARYDPLFRANAGRKVFDIVPRTAWHKGAAVVWINQRLRPDVTVYLGDDVSDEDAFRVLPDAITIKVGPATETGARYRLPDPAAVRDFLLWLARPEQG